MNLPQHSHTARAPITTNEAHVWTVRLDASDSRLNECFVHLAKDERERAAEFQLEAPRRRYVAARAALRHLLGNYLGASAADVQLTVDRNGKPRLDRHAHHVNELDWRFNVAHSGSLIAIAVTQSCEVGIDVEQQRAVQHSEQIARRYFHSAEHDEIREASPADRDATFLRCWTAKEAVLKAVGTGIIGSLSELRVPTAMDARGWIEAPTRTSDHSPVRCWLERLDLGDEYPAAVAFVEAQRTVRIMEFDWQFPVG
jgi:4'-phosphopantetheinyl transferase